jgi:hypothetical protein
MHSKYDIEDLDVESKDSRNQDEELEANESGDEEEKEEI